MGDTNGAMSYIAGGNNVFIDLSKGGTLAKANDNLVNGTTTVVITTPTQTANISVGGTTGLPNTVQGLVNAINNAGLGVTASFTNAAQAGSNAVAAGAATDTGIDMTAAGAGVGGGTTPDELGTLTVAKAAERGIPFPEPAIRM